MDGEKGIIMVLKECGKDFRMIGRRGRILDLDEDTIRIIIKDKDMTFKGIRMIGIIVRGSMIIILELVATGHLEIFLMGICLMEGDVAEIEGIIRLVNHNHKRIEALQKQKNPINSAFKVLLDLKG